jgi:hypothetical protein
MISFFLPIRKNSLRIKNKNIIRIKKYRFGLTEIKINQLNKLRKILKNKKIKSEYVVSTDCDVFKKYLKNFPWIRIHSRSSELSGDDCIDNLIKIVPDICNNKYILWTHVTSPLFDESDYLNFIVKYFSLKKKYDSAFSATLLSTFVVNKSGKWISHNYKLNKWPRTQDLDPLYCVNNAAFINSRSNYIKYNDRLSRKALPIKTRKGADLDIDSKEDLDYLKFLI